MKNSISNLKSVAYGITFTICLLVQQSTYAQTAWVASMIDYEDNLNDLSYLHTETKSDYFINSIRPTKNTEKTPTAVELEAEMIAAAKEKIRIDSFELCMHLVQREKWEPARNALVHYVRSYPEPRANYQAAIYNLAMTKMNTADYLGAVKLYKEFLLERDIPLEQKQEVEFYHALLILNFNGDSGEKYMLQIAADYGHNFQTSAEGILSIR